MKKNKLKKLLEVFQPDAVAVDFKAFDESVAKLKTNLKEKIQAQTLDDVNRQLEKFRKALNLGELPEIAGRLEESVNQKIGGIEELLSEEIAAFKNLADSGKKTTDEEIKTIAGNIKVLEVELDKLNEQKIREKAEAENELAQLREFTEKSNKTLTQISEQIKTDLEAVKNDKTLEKKLDGQIEIFTETLEKIRREFNNRLANLGGGNANRDITIGGNASTLSKYADINFKAGTNVTIAYANNNTTKKLDVTIAATGGSGTTRQIQTLIASSIIGTLAGTDQVYLCNGGLQITLPTAVSDTNLYTIKNIGTSSVLVNTTSAQTIDGSATIIMPVQYTAVDIVGDDSNWHIT